MKSCATVTFIICIFSISAIAANESREQGTSRDMETEIFTSFMSDMRYALRIYRECSRTDISACLKMKLITAIDRASRNFEGDVYIAENIHLIPDTTGKPDVVKEEISEQELESTLPQSEEDKENALNDLILERILRFMKGHVLQMNLHPEEFESNSLEEGRKKSKKYVGLLILPLLFGASLVPIALGSLALLAGKALLVSKIALVLASIIGLKKLFSSHEDHHDVHYGRKINEEEDSEPDPHLFAYRSYVHQRTGGKSLNTPSR